MKAPFFIIGNPRSGTTLLRLMLASHPHLLVAPECGFALWLAKTYGELDIHDPEVVRRYAEDVHASKKFETWGVELDELAAYLQTARAESYADLVSSVYACYGERINKEYIRWGDKNNYYLNHIGELRNLYPSAQFIHIVRDGRDVACSYLELSQKNLNSKYAPNLPADIGEIAEEWRSNIETIRAGLSLLNKNQYTEIRFSDLVGRPAAVLRELCSFLHTEFSSSMLEYYHKNKTERLEPSETMGWKQKTLMPPQEDRINRYKQDLAAKETQVFECIAGEQLSHYGFF